MYGGEVDGGDSGLPVAMRWESQDRPPRMESFVWRLVHQRSQKQENHDGYY